MNGGPPPTPTLDARRQRLGLRTGLPAIVVGIAAITLGRSFDGFVEGLFLGGGMALTLVGVYVLAATSWPRGGRSEATSEWLPSRDGARPGHRSER